ncbi:MAG: hypothetical protein ACQCN6_10505 [Candidatus Bathyarchaeia archaeon]|jgi:hypothetical protein
MPDNEIHCKHTLENYGIDGKEIHIWIDEPCKIYGSSHRQVRHNVEGIKDAVRIFGAKYGEEIVKKVMIDHILLDAEFEKQNKVIEGIVEIKPIQTVKRREDLEKEENTNANKELKISEIKTKDIKDYLRFKFLDKEEKQFWNAYSALISWERFCLNRDNPYSPIELNDLAKYTEFLKNKSENNTASSYLHYLIAYFKFNNDIELSNFGRELKKGFGKLITKAKKQQRPIPEQDIITLNHYLNSQSKVRRRYKIIMRILLLENIKVTDIDKIRFVPIVGGNYQFSINNQISPPLNEETIKLAEAEMQENLKRGDNRVLTTNREAIDEQMKIYAKGAGIKYDVTPYTLKRFSKHRTKEELISILQR